MKVLSRTLLFLSLVFTVGCSSTDELDRAGELYRSGNVSASEQAFRELAGKKLVSPGTRAKALFNLGVVLQGQKKYDDAIAAFTRIFDAGADDREPGEHLMECCRNYGHRACLRISACHDEAGRVREALHWAEKARTEFPCQDWCGTCAEQDAKRVTAVIRRLKSKL